MANAIQGSGIFFHPLYWVHHDCWAYTNTGNPRYPEDYKFHWGHVHFFMLSLTANSGGDAFSGTQNFRFSIQDVWGPRSSDPNQSLSYRVVGTPKWYWHVQELWRRVYVQTWDEKTIPEEATGVVGRRGIRWDACSVEHMKGPFKEGKGSSPVFLTGARTLPVEYFSTEAKDQKFRDNYVRDRAHALIEEWQNGPLNSRFPKTFNEDDWGLDHAGVLGATDPKGNRKVPSFPDALYINPTIEYQLVTQMDWDRMPGWEQAHDIDENNFGDGWENSVGVPFVNPLTGKYNSPFGPAPGDCRPPGQYFGVDVQGRPLVPVERQLRHRDRDDAPPTLQSQGGYDLVNEPFGLPSFTPNDPKWQPSQDYPDRSPINNDPRPNLSGQPMTFHDPYGRNDGRWVQQCLGGLVQVRAEVTLEHKLGGRSTQWITGVQLVPTSQPVASDQS